MRFTSTMILLVIFTLLASASPVVAHGFNAAGIAQKGDEQFRIFIGRSADAPNGTAQYGITITDLQLNVVESRLFWADDNFVGDEELESPTYFNDALHGESLTSGVDFEFDGVQVNLMIQASGIYQDYEFTISTTFVG